MDLHHVFGLRGDLKGNITYVDETTVLYPCGHVVVVYNTETKVQRFIFGNEKSGGITALACSHHRKLVAVAERGEKPVVTIYDINTLKKRKVLTCSEMQSREIVNLAFSSDNKQLLTQGAGPDWTMILWAWEKSKMLIVAKASNIQGTTVTFSDFCPWDTNTILVIGDGLLRFLRIQDGTVKPLSFPFKREIQQYTCHTWLPEERLVVATDTGELLLFESFEFRGTLSFLKEDDDLEMLPIDSVVAYNKGFVVGGAHNTLRVFEQSEDPHEYFRHTKTFTIDGKQSRVMNLAISPSEDNLACSLANNQIYVLSLSNTDILKAEEMNFDLLTTSVHGPYIPDKQNGATITTNGNGSSSTQGFLGLGVSMTGVSEDENGTGSAQITGLDVCIRKPFVATCGVDRTVRVWNYLEKNVVLMKEFNETPTSLSFHPSGLHLLVGFSDKLRLMNLLMDDIQTFKEFPIKGCRVCCFSNGGQYFAAANGNVVQLFQTYTFECLSTLRGHAGRVHSISWSEDDRALSTAAADGIVYRWSVNNGRKDGEATFKGMSISCVAAADVDCNFAVCSAKPDMKMREVQMTSGNVKYELSGPQGLGFNQFTMSRSGRLLFATLFDISTKDKGKDGSSSSGTPSGGGTAAMNKQNGTGAVPIVGTTVMLSLPLSSNQPKSKKVDDGLEEKDPSAVETSNNNNNNFMNGQNGIPENAAEIQLDKLKRCTVHYGGITRLCTSHDDQFLFTAGEDGTLAMYAITDDSETNAGRKNREKEPPIQFAEEILVTKSDLEEKTSLMHDLKNKVDELTLHNEYQLRLKDMNYNERIKEIKAKFTDELEQDRRKYDKLKKEKVTMESMFKERLEKLINQHEKQVQNLEKSYQDKIDAEVQRFEGLVSDREQLALKWDEQNQVLVEGHESYVNQVTEEFEEKLTEELKHREHIEKDKEVLVKQFEDSKTEVEEDADLEIEELKEKYVAKLTVEREATLRLKGENGIMKKKFSALQNDIEEQKDRIKQLTEREMDLYERIKGLEKDIHGHKKEIKEREETIQDKEKRIYDLKKKNQELEKFKFVLDYKIKELKRQIEPRENEIADMRQQIKEMDLELEQYQKSNAALDLMIGELRLKIEGMQKEIDQQNEEIRLGKVAADHCRLELHDAIKSLEDHTDLKSKVVKMYKKYVQSAAQSAQGKEDESNPSAVSKPKPSSKKQSGKGKGKDQATGAQQREYNRQREYLEKSVESLKRKLSKDMKMHQADKKRLLRESVDLTNEINVLRRELHSITRKKNGKNSSSVFGSLNSASLREETSVSSSQFYEEECNRANDAAREIELQRKQIQQLTQQINRLETALGLK